MDSKQIIEAFTLLSKDKNVEKTYNDLKKSKGVIVFGTGNLGNIVLAALKKADIKFEVVWIPYNF